MTTTTHQRGAGRVLTLAGGRNVEETITADLEPSMATLASLSDNLIASIKAGADDTIRNQVKGWLNSDNTSCRCRVHFASKADHHVRCRVKIYARPAGCIGTP